MVMDIVFIVAGFAAISSGILGRTFYYGDEYSSSDKVAPTNLSRVFFISIGSIFILMGFANLFGFVSIGRGD